MKLIVGLGGGGGKGGPGPPGEVKNWELHWGVQNPKVHSTADLQYLLVPPPEFISNGPTRNRYSQKWGRLIETSPATQTPEYPHTFYAHNLYKI